MAKRSSKPSKKTTKNTKKKSFSFPTIKTIPEPNITPSADDTVSTEIPK